MNFIIFNNNQQRKRKRERCREKKKCRLPFISFICVEIILIFHFRNTLNVPEHAGRQEHRFRIECCICTLALCRPFDSIFPTSTHSVYWNLVRILTMSQKGYFYAKHVLSDMWTDGEKEKNGQPIRIFYSFWIHK